ncbi:MAG: 2-oxoglutarate ferredoxin oxidoreductase subunit alpha, partial [Acidimicrobiia bacterium]|nr:2-oxoglutarate ferredoxin oxidoreductase subunit alpha [Acidimicrobiia bacterium]
YLRDETTLARPWAIPGTAGLEHRVGGLEKQDGTGNVSYDPLNHEKMTLLRENKINGIADDIPDVAVDSDEGATTLVLGWGSTYASIVAGVRRVRKNGHKVAQAHLRHLHPFPKNLESVVKSYETVLVPELNRGQLSRLMRERYLVDAKSLTKVQGKPFMAEEIEEALMETLS